MTRRNLFHLPIASSRIVAMNAAVAVSGGPLSAPQAKAMVSLQTGHSGGRDRCREVFWA